MNATELIETLIGLQSLENERKSVFLIFEWTNEQFTQSNFDICDELLAIIDPTVFGEDILVGLITSTYCAKKYLPSRQAFIDKSLPVFKQWMSESEAIEFVGEIT